MEEYIIKDIKKSIKTLKEDIEYSKEKLKECSKSYVNGKMYLDAFTSSVKYYESDIKRNDNALYVLSKILCRYENEKNKIESIKRLD